MTKKKNENKKVLLTLDNSLDNSLTSYSLKHDIPKSNVVRKVLRSFFNEVDGEENGTASYIK